MKRLTLSVILLFFLVPSVAFGEWDQIAFFIHSDAEEAAPSGEWENVDTGAADGAAYAFVGSSRNVITAAMTGAGGPWTKIRVTFDGCTGDQTFEASVCIQDTTTGCTATPTRLQRSGSDSWTLGTTPLVSDETTFSFDTDDALLINMYYATRECYQWQSGWQCYWWGTDNNVMTQDPGSADDADAANLDFVTLIEGWNPD